MEVLKKLLGALVVVALALVVVRAIVGYLIFAPRLSSPNAYSVAETYYQAQVWSLNGLARSSLTNELQPTEQPPFFNDVFLASDLAVAGPGEIAKSPQYAEIARFTVTYESRWKANTGEPPGPRTRLMTLGRNPGGAWKVIAEGTGP